MDIELLAEKYAEQKVSKLSSLIEDAYVAGYEQGLLESEKRLKLGGIEFVDLGLPSGTLWSKSSLNYENYGYKQRLFSYSEAVKLNIPTVEQWNELCECCRFLDEKIIGPSGGRIGYDRAPAGYLIYNLGEGCEKNRNMFWLKGELDSENNAPTMLYDYVGNIIKGTNRHFTGFKLPIFLVKNIE